MKPFEYDKSLCEVCRALSGCSIKVLGEHDGVQQPCVLVLTIAQLYMLHLQPHRIISKDGR